MVQRMRLLDDDQANIHRSRHEPSVVIHQGVEIMRSHNFIIPEDMIFHRSPSVRINTDDEELSSFVGRLIDESRTKQWCAAAKWQCYTRKASAKQRDGHLQRLKGVMVLEKILRWATLSSESDCEVYLYGQVSEYGYHCGGIFC